MYLMAITYEMRQGRVSTLHNTKHPFGCKRYLNRWWFHRDNIALSPIHWLFIDPMLRGSVKMWARCNYTCIVITVQEYARVTDKVIFICNQYVIRTRKVSVEKIWLHKCWNVTEIHIQALFCFEVEFQIEKYE